MIIAIIGQTDWKQIEDGEAIPEGWLEMQSEPPTEGRFNIDGEWKNPADFLV